jgi:hydroxyacyl-ACP dehydratase HTD2-like protein with hotdog domain
MKMFRMDAPQHAGIDPKQWIGRSESHEDARLLISEEHDIVYRDAPSSDDERTASPPTPRTSSLFRDFVADETLLFRYSALTFNGHRIHYDRRYVTEVERYPGLISLPRTCPGLRWFAVSAARRP